MPHTRKPDALDAAEFELLNRLVAGDSSPVRSAAVLGGPSLLEPAINVLSKVHHAHMARRFGGGGDASLRVASMSGAALAAQISERLAKPTPPAQIDALTAIYWAEVGALIHAARHAVATGDRELAAAITSLATQAANIQRALDPERRAVEARRIADQRRALIPEQPPAAPRPT